MNHFLAGEVERARDLRITRVAAVERAAFVFQCWAGGSVDGAVDAATAQEGFVGRVDDAVDLELCDVVADRRDCVVVSLVGGCDFGFGGGD